MLYTNFDITIPQSATAHPPQPEATSYATHFAYRDQHASGTLHINFALEQWQEAISLLADPTRNPGQRTIRDLGQRLFRALFHPSESTKQSSAGRDLWLRARADLESGLVSKLRLRLAIHPPTLAALPWEALADPERGTIFAADAESTLLRIENRYQHVAARPVRTTALPLRILLAAPEDPSGQLDIEREIAQLDKAAQMLTSAAVQIIPLTGRFGTIELRQQLAQHQPHILHITTHGEPHGLLFWQDDQPVLAASASLRLVVQDSDSLRFVFLNACLAGQTHTGSASGINNNDAFDTVGPQLVQSGLPAVLAMQYEIDDAEATHFAVALYKALCSGPSAGQIDAAVGHARAALFMRNPDSFAFGTPVLWLNGRGAPLFRLAPAQVQTLANQQRRARHLATRPTPAASTDHSADAASLQAVLHKATTWLEQNPAPDSATSDAQFSSARLNAEQRQLATLFTQQRRTIENLVQQANRLLQSTHRPVDEARKIAQFEQALTAAQKSLALMMRAGRSD